MGKRVKSQRQPKIEKTPRISKDANKLGQQFFRWRVHYDYIDLDHEEWGWGYLQIADFFNILVNRLHSYEDMTWDDLVSRRHCHPMPVTKIEIKAQNRLSKKCADIDTLHSIDINKKCRVWGHKIGRSLYLIWHDPQHTVYLAKKR